MVARTKTIAEKLYRWYFGFGSARPAQFWEWSSKNSRGKSCLACLLACVTLPCHAMPCLVSPCLALPCLCLVANASRALPHSDIRSLRHLLRLFSLTLFGTPRRNIAPRDRLGQNNSIGTIPAVSQSSSVLPFFLPSFVVAILTHSRRLWHAFLNASWCLSSGSSSVVFAVFFFSFFILLYPLSFDSVVLRTHVIFEYFW